MLRRGQRARVVVVCGMSSVAGVGDGGGKGERSGVRVLSA